MARSKSVGENVSELWELLKSYATQETIDPLRGLGGYLGRGMGAAVLTGLGLFFLLLGLLRALQFEGRDWASANLSVVLYLIVAVAAAVCLVVLGTRIAKGFEQKDES